MSESVDLTLAIRAHQIYKVDFSQVQGESDRQVNTVETIAGFRYKFV
jgi:opacity protein-like surface antigen